LPGNDDQAAMASLLSFHLLGLYPGIIYRPYVLGEQVNDSISYSPFNDAIPHSLALHSEIYHPQLIP
jgi:hypothetical protein